MNNNDIDINITEVVQEFESDLNDTSNTLQCFYSESNNDIVNVSSYNTDTKFESIPKIFYTEQFVADFISVRDEVKSLVNGCKTLLKEIPLQKGMIKPSMITAISQLNNSINTSLKTLIDLHTTILKLQKENDMTEINNGTVINNNTFMCGAKEINDILKDALKELKAGN